MSISLVSLAARLVHVHDGFNSWDTYTRRVEKALFVLLVLPVKFFVLEGGRKKASVSKIINITVVTDGKGVRMKISVMTSSRSSPHSGPGYWEESRRWGKTPPQIQLCYRPRISLGKKRGCLEKGSLMLVGSYSSNNSPKVLMSSLSMKSHNRSITSWTCFMHFPCWKMIRRCQISQYLRFLNRGTEANQPTHALVAEAHGAGFAFAEEEKTAIVQDERSAGSIFSPAAHFTGVLRLCKELTWLV